MTDQYKEIVQADLVLQMSLDIKEVLLKEMKMHGDDPANFTIVCAAFAKALFDMEKEFPNNKEQMSNVVMETILAYKMKHSKE